jgi:hypothetical protein
MAFVAMLATVPLRADPSAAELDSAKTLFRRGVALLAAGDTERALDFFLRSRDVVPSSKNTVNAAICLEGLGRLDEALEMYEEVLTRFASQLGNLDRENLVPVIERLRRHVGYLEISSNVDGLIVIDGRARGKLPLRTSLRVLPGRRSVRVVKDGYRSFEGATDIVAAETESLTAELEPLAGTGALRVESSAGESASVFIDGKRVGETPWEGTLDRGDHVLCTAWGDRGSAPVLVQVVERKTLVVRTSEGPLAPQLDVSAAPRTAQLFLGDVPLGNGAWAGRLPFGTYQFRALEPGYFEASRPFTLRPGAPPAKLAFTLTRDPHDPRWPKTSTVHVGLGVNASALYAPMLQSGAEGRCPSLCAESRTAWGGAASLSVLAVHRSGFGAELQGGYAAFRQSFARAVFNPRGPVTATYALEQTLRARGPFVMLRGRLEHRIGRGFDFVSALGAGLFSAKYRSDVSGSVWTTGPAVPVRSSGEVQSSETTAFVSAALGAQRRVGALSLHAVFGVWFFPAVGPQLDGPQLGVSPNCAATAPSAVGCTPNTNAIAGERVHGAFWAVVPELGAQYAF